MGTRKKDKMHDFPMKINADAIVDDKPPKLNVSLLYKPRDLITHAMRMRQLDQDNLKLLRNINIIFRQKGVVDCWNPNIRYVSRDTVEESNKKRISLQNKILLERIHNVTSIYARKDLLQDWKDMHSKLHSKKMPFGNDFKTAMKGFKGVLEPYNKDICMVNNMDILNFMSPATRVKCYFEIQIFDTKQALGKIVFELYTDIVPRTCKNFETFCRGTNGLSYKNTPFHRIVSGYWCQGGDVTMFNGTGGTSIYGDSFENENFHLRHGGRGVLSMCNPNNAGNDSKFNLTFRRLETMDGHRTVFGKIISGYSALYKIEDFGTRSGKPTKKVIVSNCGIL